MTTNWKTIIYSKVRLVWKFLNYRYEHEEDPFDLINIQSWFKSIYLIKYYTFLS